MELALSPSPDQLLNRADIRKITRVTDVSLWRWIRDGKFPSPIKLTRSRAGRCFWRLSEVNAWLESQTAARVS